VSGAFRSGPLAGRTARSLDCRAGLQPAQYARFPGAGQRSGFTLDRGRSRLWHPGKMNEMAVPADHAAANARIRPGDGCGITS
jgi:hypothetical protein